MAKKSFFVDRLAIDYGAFAISLDGTGTVLTADRAILFDTKDSDRTLTLGGDLNIANNFTTSGNFPLTLTLTGSTSITLPTSGTLATLGSNTFSGAQTINAAGSTTAGSLTFGGSTMNWIDFGTTGTGSPAVGTRTAGTKIVLSNAQSATTTDFSLGVSSSDMWFAAPSTSNGFKWYSGGSILAGLDGFGGFQYFGYAQIINVNPTIYLDESDQAAANARWTFDVQSQVLRITTRDSSTNAVAKTVLAIDRAGNLVTSTTGAITGAVGTTAQRPTGVAGMMRLNTDTTSFEGYDGTTWKSLGSNQRFTIGSSAPASPSPGDLWLYTDNGAVYTYFNDGDSSQWVEFGADFHNGLTASALSVVNPVATPKDGDIRVTGGVVELYANSSWRQIYPAVYS